MKCVRCGAGVARLNARYCGSKCRRQVQNANAYAKRRAARLARRKRATPRCVGCGDPLAVTARAGTKCCGAACRLRAWRHRK